MSNSSFPLNSRRRFVKGLAAGGVLLGLSSRAMQAVAQLKPGEPLRGTDPHR
jgi:hypothetical protein